MASTRTFPCSVHRRVNTWLLAQCLLLFCIRTQDFFTVPDPSPFLSQNSSFLFGCVMVLTNRLSAVNDTRFTQQHFAPLSVADGSDRSWLRLPLSIDHIIWLTALLHNPILGVSGNSREAMPSVLISCQLGQRFPFFCLPAYQQ